MLLKFNNIRDLSDARYAAAAMADWIGFGVGKPDSLSAAAIQQIVGWCAGPALILEIGRGIGSEVVASMLKVLPADGLEVEAEDYERLNRELNLNGLQWLVKGNEAKDGSIGHGTDLKYVEKLMVCVNPEQVQASVVMAAEPWAISVDCVPGNDGALKDFDHWNRFFEELGIF